MSSSFNKIVGGALKLKGGESLIGATLSVADTREKKESKKKLKKKLKQAAEEAAAEAAAKNDAYGIGGEVGGKLNKTYEDLFPHEVKRMTEAKGRTVCFGTNYRQAPEVLHGYDQSLKGKKNLTAEERLDMRSGQKADKYCK